MYIKNTSQLLFEDLGNDKLILRKIALEALEISISAVKPKNILEKSIKCENGFFTIQNTIYNLNNFEKIYIIGGGKATAEMAITLENLLLKDKNIDYKGIINVPENSEILENYKKSKIKINFGSHPIPNDAGVNGTKLMMEIIEKSNKNDLIFCLISGGGSALLPLPKKGIKLEDLQKVNSLLLKSGASIHEINIIRKHLSDFKGGNLAKKLFNSSKATLISLIISDVVGDNLDSIASGPTVPDKSTFKDALSIIKKYNLQYTFPKSVIEYLKKGSLDIRLENPKLGDKCFTNVHNYLIGSVSLAVQELTHFLANLGFEINLFMDTVIGEAKEFGKRIYKKFIRTGINFLDKHEKKRIAMIGTGELTVTIRGKGIGGRNQEMLLSFLNNIKDKNFGFNFVVTGVNLDGIEGNSNAMGALADNNLLNEINLKKVNVEKFLENNDSNRFFKKFGAEIITGPTGCNVNDIFMVLLSKTQ